MYIASPEKAEYLKVEADLIKITNPKSQDIVQQAEDGDLNRLDSMLTDNRPRSDGEESDESEVMMIPGTEQDNKISP
jgi:hypothetical protein